MRTKFTMTRDNYLSNFIAKGFKKVISTTGTELYMMTDSSNAPFLAIGFSGKKAKYDFYFAFRTAERRAEYVASWENGIRNRNAYKAERKEKRLAPTTLKNGDILYSTWGYDQTNVDFYQVTKVIGTRTIEIREIAVSKNFDNMPFDQFKALPVKDHFVGEPMKKVVNGNYNSVSIESYSSASPWDGRAISGSCYA